MSEQLSFQAPWWLPGGHVQTLWRRFARSPGLAARQRRRLELEDGDFMDLDWQLPETGTRGDPMAPITVIIHGLCGSSDSHYVLSLQDQLHRRGMASVGINLRGCSGEPNRMARAYHSGATEDLDAVLASLSGEHPGRRFNFVGYSLGANLLLKWLGEKPVPAQVHRAVAVSAPYSLAACAEEMVTGGGRLYGRYFLSQLRQDLDSKRRLFLDSGRHEELARLQALGPLDDLRNIRDFDDRVTAPLHGFADAADYYARCSSDQFIGGIETPTLLISSANDPIIPARLTPPAAGLPARVQLELWSAGGHVGFRAVEDSNWLERRILGFLDT